MMPSDKEKTLLKDEHLFIRVHTYRLNGRSSAITSAILLIEHPSCVNSAAITGNVNVMCFRISFFVTLTEQSINVVAYSCAW